MRASLGLLLALPVRAGDAKARPIPEVRGRPVDEARPLRLVPLAQGLEEPVAVASAPKDEDRLYVAERAGRVRVIKRRRRSWSLAGPPFLDLGPRILMRSREQGLLGLAFHPDYEENREFFTFHTSLVGDVVVSRWRASSPDEADPASAQVLLTQKHGVPFNYGGCLAFGPEGHLYISLGDGGLRGDPAGNAQSLGTWLGKILRVDPKPGEDKPYRIPTDNPFAQREGARPEIWTLGLRNPRSFSFDGHHLYVADTGERSWDEIEVEPLQERGGKNYGWSLAEGDSQTGRGKRRAGLVPPAAALPCEPACGVVGGPVYQGREVPGLQKAYIYGRTASHRLWMLRYDDGRVVESRELTTNIEPLRPALSLSALGRDPEGEILAVDGEEGVVYRLERNPEARPAESKSGRRLLP